MNKLAVFVFAELAIFINSLGCDIKRNILAVGDKVPVFTLTDLEGHKVFSENLFGRKEVILSFWASWCPECRQQMPLLDKFFRVYKDKVEIVGINVGESKEQVASFVKEKKIGYQILLDPKREVSRLYGVIGVPTNILINKDGLIKNLNIDIREMDSYLRQNN